MKSGAAVDKPRTLLSEMGLWKFVPKALGPETPLDEMIAKAKMSK